MWHPCGIQRRRRVGRGAEIACFQLRLKGTSDDEWRQEIVALMIVCRAREDCILARARYLVPKLVAIEGGGSGSGLCCVRLDFQGTKKEAHPAPFAARRLDGAVNGASRRHRRHWREKLGRRWFGTAWQSWLP